MKRAALVVAAAAALLATAWPSARGGDARGDVCAGMTAAKLLENPVISQGYAEALRSGDAEEVARFEEGLRHIRSVHGCEGDVALPAGPPAAPSLPRGHPPIRTPPVDDGRRAPALFSDPGAVTI